MEQQLLQEQLRFERLQRIYDFQTNNAKIYENSFTNYRFQHEPDLLTHQQARLLAQHKQEQLFAKLCNDAEDGEIINFLIELADFRLMRCIFDHHLSPKERILEIPIASQEYMQFFHL